MRRWGRVIQIIPDKILHKASTLGQIERVDIRVGRIHVVGLLLGQRSQATHQQRQGEQEQHITPEEFGY